MKKSVFPERMFPKKAQHATDCAGKPAASPQKVGVTHSNHAGFPTISQHFSTEIGESLSSGRENCRNKL
jgi:hypothetical protein